MTKEQRVVKYEDGGPDAAVASFIADVLELAGLFRRGADGIAREEGQTQARWYALSVFSAEPLTVSRAARRLGTTRQGLQRTADDLVDRGLAMVEPNPDHRTSPFIRLTEEGRAVLTRVSEAATVTRRRWLPDPDLDELEGAHAVVRQLRDTLREQL